MESPKHPPDWFHLIHAPDFQRSKLGVPNAVLMDAACAMLCTCYAHARLLAYDGFE